MNYDLQKNPPNISELYNKFKVKTLLGYMFNVPLIGIDFNNKLNKESK
jgi:hypothetical protein